MQTGDVARTDAVAQAFREAQRDIGAFLKR
jgi:hypothetical protein